jgi:hypothetical protein
MANYSAARTEKEKNKLIGKKIANFGCLPLLIVFILFLFFSKSEETVNENAISGLMPVDVYLNMEKEGFPTKKIYNAEYGCSWENSKEINGIQYRVLTFSNDASSVETITASAIVYPPKTIEASKYFFNFISSLRYDNANPQIASKWISDHFYDRKSSTVIGGVKFTLDCPTKFSRILFLEKGTDSTEKKELK